MNLCMRLFLLCWSEDQAGEETWLYRRFNEHDNKSPGGRLGVVGAPDWGESLFALRTIGRPGQRLP
jgi:hypothetical protein